MIRGTVDRERLEARISLLQDDIDERLEWTRRGWISEEQRDYEVTDIRRRMYAPRVMLDVMNGVPISL
jgi:hypothetical protein